MSGAILVYCMQTSRLPIATIEERERVNRNFFGGSHLETICQLARSGGLGVKRLRYMNRALLAKLA